MKNFKKTFILIILTLLPFTFIDAQSYTKYMQQGKDFYNKSEYMTALERFDLAYDMAANEVEKKEAKSWRNKSREKIKSQQTELIKALDEAEKQRKLALEANEKAQRIIDAFYFYDDKFALVFKDDKFGYMDKNGNTKINYQYDKAQPFDGRTGLAKVMRKINDTLNINYILDTSGNEYQMTEKISQLYEWTDAIDLSDQDMDSIPTVIFENTQLKILLMPYNKVKSIPASIGKLKNLKILDFDPETKDFRFYKGANEIKTLPPEIKNLTRLTELNLHGNALEELPIEIGALTSLLNLNIGLNYVKNLPTEIRNCKNLRKLILNDNNGIKLPDEIKNLHNLKELQIGHSQLHEFPKIITEIISLEKLDLYFDRISSVPKEIRNLKSLIELNLSNNNLMSLPDEIKYLTSLKHLDLTRNNFNEQEQLRIKKLLPNCEIKF